MADATVETKFCNNCLNLKESSIVMATVESGRAFRSSMTLGENENFKSKKQISAGNFVMHEMHCKRHISLCDHCKEPIPKGEMEVHYEENHAKMPCPKCHVEVEKMYLEEHEETSCAKKPMSCVYCELQIPKNEFDAHIDYCGSRTEQCHKCQQYVKLRDQVKHDESKCQFPEVKVNGRNGAENNEYLTGLPAMDPFAFDEFSRILGRTGATGARYGGAQYSRLEQNVFDSEVNRPPVNNNAVKKTNKGKGKSDLNKKREQGRTGNQATDNNHDRLLAMHLAQDLNQEEDIDTMRHAFEKSQSPTTPTSFDDSTYYNRNHFSEDMVMIPCEFCGEPFIADDLVQHQSGCSLNRISSMLPQLTPVNNRMGEANNKGSGVRSPLIEPPAIINNLRNFEANEWVDDTAALEPSENMDDDGDMLLPCEFCDELYPMDSLVQHQAMCDSNATMTPRVMSPAEPYQRPKLKTSMMNAQRLTADFPNIASKRHQPPPGLSLDPDSDEDGTKRSNYTIGATHRVRKPTTNANGASSKPKVTSPGNIRSTIQRYGVESADKGDYYIRQRTSSRTNPEAGADTVLQSRSQVLKKRTGNEVRTRGTLNNFLSGEGEGSSHDLLGHVGQVPKMQKNDLNGSRQRAVPAQHAGLRGAAKVKSSSTAKDAQREPTRYGASTRSSYQSQPKNRPGQPDFDLRVRPLEADEVPSSVTSQRQRTRANVFGASTNSKQIRKRSENS